MSLMKYRTVTLQDGTSVQIPQGIQRIDSKSTHGWQVRYQGTKFFSDNSCGGAMKSLANAIHELLSRITAGPASLALRREASPRKRSDLPVGLSGPIVRERPGRAPVAELSVLLPQFGGQPRPRSIHIGSQNTYSVERYNAAVAKGMELRAQAIERYERDALRARREVIKQLRLTLQSLK